jgi:hypothetical protein
MSSTNGTATYLDEPIYSCSKCCATIASLSFRTSMVLKQVRLVTYNRSSRLFKMSWSAKPSPEETDEDSSYHNLSHLFFPWPLYRGDAFSYMLIGLCSHKALRTRLPTWSTERRRIDNYCTLSPSFGSICLVMVDMCVLFFRTGVHTVADIFCTGCGTRLGWHYFKASETSQKYKEGKLVMASIRLCNGCAWHNHRHPGKFLLERERLFKENKWKLDDKPQN